MKPYYSDGGITIYHGDCREVLPTLGTFDLLLTDPPYGINMSGGVGGGGYDGFGKAVKRAPKQYADNWDKCRPDKSTFDTILAAAKLHIIWGGNYFADMLPASTHWICWDKLQTMPTFSDYELAWTSSDRCSVKKVVIAQNGMTAGEKDRFHPTQKPIALMKWCLLNYAGASVLDCFMGSGTTLVAAKELGRSATGIEREEKYCEIAAARLSQGVLGLDFSPANPEESP